MPLSRFSIAAVLILCSFAATPVLADEPPVNPFPRQRLPEPQVFAWEFDKGPAGWQAQHDCDISAENGVLKIASGGEDPYLRIPVQLPANETLTVRMRARFRTADDAQFFWTPAGGGEAEIHSRRFSVIHDGQWREYTVVLPVRGEIQGLRLDPGAGRGEAEVDWIRISSARLHPLEIVQVTSRGEEIVLRVMNHSQTPLVLSAGGSSYQASAGTTTEIKMKKPAGTAPFEMVRVAVTAAGLPPVTRFVAVYRPQATAEWIVQKSDRLSARIAPDGTGAVLELDGKAVALLAPIVHREGVVPKLAASDDGNAVVLAGDGVNVRMVLAGEELAVDLRADAPVEGPVLRAIGPLTQGLFAGLEYLGKGERSSSTADIETEDHLRFSPDPLKVTMPLMAVVTDRVTAAMTWKDMALQPRFASPNFVDGADDHRLSLTGAKISATLRVAAPQPITETVLWAVTKFGLPPLPKAPRTPPQQWDLCLKAFNGPLRGATGWGHCVEDNWPRNWYAPHASAIFRMTGQPPEMSGPIAGGGGHIDNDAIFFVTGQAKRWLDLSRAEARGFLRRQKPDGSFRYDGPYLRGHYEDTASGVCARPAVVLLRFARQTGDKEAQAAGLRTLEYMKRFDVPRGAQYWELSIHTPDILASAYLVQAYVLGYEATGKAEYLALARQWALSGVPFVYLWSRYPVMAYATPPVYGATNWRAPLWIGRPVQWCGICYAYALTLLAPHDRTLDWKRLAEGILISGEQQQYPDGDKAGCLPDVFELQSQTRAGPSINPSALVFLRLAVSGEPEGLSVAVKDGRRILAPFPVSIEGGKARIRGQKGLTYQILVDGGKIIDVPSQGEDVVSLD